MTKKIIELKNENQPNDSKFFFEQMSIEDRAVHQLEILMLEYKQWERNSSKFAKPHMERIAYSIFCVWFVLTGKPILKDFTKEIDEFLCGVEDPNG